ncbi:MAG: NYN domain-containing protein [Microthrixaceae bacterium]
MLDQDVDFRERVAAGVNEGDLDRASWLFLTRPEGWLEEYELLVAALEEQKIEQESRSAERRLEQLEATYGRTKQELVDSRRHVKSLESKLDHDRVEIARLVGLSDSLTARVVELEAERGSVIRNLKTAEQLSVERLARVRALEAELEKYADKVEAVSKDVRASVTESGPTTESGSATGSGSMTGPESTTGSGYNRGGPTRPGPTGDGLGESRSGATSSGPVDVDPVTASSSIAEAIRALADIASALDKAALALGATSDNTQVSTPAQSPTRASARVSDIDAQDPNGPSLVTSGSRPARRSPLRLLRGALEGSRAGIEQILTTPGVVVYVDGYNVSMEAWPSLNGAAQRQSLIDMLGSIAARTRAEIHAVFDGDNDGRRPSVSSPLPVRVHFSHADIEADDQILGYVADLAPNRPVLVISSDNRVRTGAMRLGANTITSSDLLAFARGTAS